MDKKVKITREAYQNYMELLDLYIKKTEFLIKELPKFKKARALSYEEWVKSIIDNQKK